MKITRKFLIAVAIVLALAVMAAPVIASPPPIYRLERSEFDMTFNIPDFGCKVTTSELSTKHFVLERPMASTNTGTATVGSLPGSYCLMVIEVPGTPLPLVIKDGDQVGFAVVDVRNPGNGTVIATYAIIPPIPGSPLLPFMPVGANAWLKKHGPSLTYEGYVYVSIPGSQEYHTEPFTAMGDPDEGFFNAWLGPWK